MKLNTSALYTTQISGCIVEFIRKFTKDIQGGFAIWFAVGAMTLAITGGAAIDISHAHRAERYLQDLTDNAALAAARDHTLETKEKRKIARGFIKEAFDLNYDLHII